MFYISEISKTAPVKFHTILQKKTYRILQNLNIPFERVSTDEAVTMKDCLGINKKLDMEMVKTLFLCNRNETEFYLFITAGDKPFRSGDFSSTLNISRVSFAPAELTEKTLGVKIGAVTVFSAVLDKNNKIKVIFDKDVADKEYCGCSDGTITGYMKIKTKHMIDKFLPFTGHIPVIIEV